MHVRESHFVLTDVPMTFVVTLTLVLSLRAHERARSRAFVPRASRSGLAAATKYNGGVALLLPLLAVLRARPHGRASRALRRPWPPAAARVPHRRAGPPCWICPGSSTGSPPGATTSRGARRLPGRL